MFKNVSLETSEKVARLIENGKVNYDDIYGKNLNNVVVEFKDYFNTKDYHNKYDNTDNAEITGMIEFCDNYVKNNPVESFINVVDEPTPETSKNEEIKEEEPCTIVKNEEDLTKKIHIPFMFTNNYVFDSDGTVRMMNSSSEDSKKELVETTGLANIIMNDPVIKELIPELKLEDIYVDHHMLLMKVRRDEEEIYRIDIINNKILVQAPFETPYMCNHEKYYFGAVPVESDLGKKILTTKNYKIKLTDDFKEDSCIFREYQNAA